MQARMRQISLLGAVAGALVVILVGTVLAQSDPLIGTWKQNLAKSKSSPDRGVKSGTLKIEAAGAGIKTTVDAVFGDGTVWHYEYTANYDGKDNPVVGNSPSDLIPDMVALTRINATTTKQVDKKGGTITSTVTSVTSNDGKTLTNTRTGTTALGQAISAVTVWDKQ